MNGQRAPVREKLGSWLLVALSCGVPCAHAQIYAARTQEGGLVLSNFRDGTTDAVTVVAGAAEQLRMPPAELPATQPGASPTRSPGGQSRDRFEVLIRRVAQEVGLAPQLLHAVIAIESGFDVRAVSHKGAQGLMQLMPETARRFGVADPFDPAQNIAGGAAYLKWLLDLFGGDVRLALAAYNAGEGAVLRAGNRIPPYPETRTYVPRVLARLRAPGPY